MKRMLMGLCLGTIIISGSMAGSLTDEGLRELRQECQMRLVDEANIAQCTADVVTSINIFNAMRYACGLALVGIGGFRIYDWYTGMQSRSTPEQIADLYKQLGELKQAKGMTSEAEQKSWLGSIGSWGKGVVTGLPTYIASTMVSGAAVGLLTAKIPISELFKSEPSFAWFLTKKTDFISECDTLTNYYRQQAIHDAFCVETVRLVEDVEKILGYIDYQISKIKKNSSMAAKVLSTRRGQLILLTNKLVDLVAQKNYTEMITAVELLNGFVQVGLTAGILQ